MWKSNNHLFGWRTSKWWKSLAFSLSNACMWTCEFSCDKWSFRFLTYSHISDAILEYFLEAALKDFVIGRVAQSHWHPDYRSSRVVLYVLVKKWDNWRCWFLLFQSLSVIILKTTCLCHMSILWVLDNIGITRKIITNYVSYLHTEWWLLNKYCAFLKIHF